MARLVVDAAAEGAYRALMTPDVDAPCDDPVLARLGAHGADYSAHLRGLNLLSYVENYVDEARRCASTERSNTAEARIFWRVFFHDILTAYIVKNTRKPHVGALGHRYDTESVVEYTRRFWNLKQQLKAFTAWTDRQSGMLDAECSRFLLFKKAKAGQLNSADLEGGGAPVDANACFLRPLGGAAWLRWTADGLDARVGGRRASHLVVLTGVGAATRLGSADGGRVLRYQLDPVTPARQAPLAAVPRAFPVAVDAAEAALRVAWDGGNRCLAGWKPAAVVVEAGADHGRNRLSCATRMLRDGYAYATYFEKNKTCNLGRDPVGCYLDGKGDTVDGISAGGWWFGRNLNFVRPERPLGRVSSGGGGGAGDDLDASTMFACSFGPSRAADVLASELAVSVAGAFLRADMTLAAPSAVQPGALRGAAFELMWAHLRVPSGRGVLRVRLLCAATGDELALGPAGVTVQGVSAIVSAIVSAAPLSSVPPLRLVYESDAAPLRAGVVGAGGAVLRRGSTDSAAGKAASVVMGVARSAEDAVTFHPAPSDRSGASDASAARAAGGRFAGSFYLRVDASGLFLNAAGAGGAPAGGGRGAVWFESASVMPSDVASLTELQGVTKWDAFVQA